MLNCEVQILDYTTSQIITLQSGQAKIQNGNFKIIHDINLRQYDTLINELTHNITKDALENRPLFPYLNHELLQTQELLNNLKPRIIKKRSLNFIGTAWKWIAGNPDHEDFVTIKDKINDSLENNNKQVIINKLLTERMNNLSKITNNIKDFVKNENSYKDNLVLSLQYKLKFLKEELINIKYAIHWAKSGIVNTMLLSQDEIKMALSILENEHLPYGTIEEALEFAKIKIITDSSSLLYIINIPITESDTFENLIVKPVRRNNVVTDIPYKIILKKNKKLYGSIKNCNKINKISICNQIDLLDLSNSSCITNLLSSLNSTCNKINGQHIPTLDNIAPGILLLNDFSGQINIDNISQNLSGTYLIKFNNATIKINGKTFTSQEASSIQVMPAIFQPTPHEKRYREILSLEMVRDLHINNTKQIDLLRNQRDYQEMVIYAPITILIIVSGIIIILKTLRKQKQEVIITERNPTPIQNPNPVEQPTIITPSFFENPQHYDGTLMTRRFYNSSLF